MNTMDESLKLPLNAVHFYANEFAECTHMDFTALKELLEQQGYVALPFQYQHLNDRPDVDQRNDNSLYVCFSGTLYIEVDGHKYELNTGDALSVPKGTTASVHANVPCQYYFCI